MTIKKSAPAPVKQPLPADDKILETADQLKVGDVLTSLAQSRSKLENLLSNISSEALDQLNTYDGLKRAIEIKESELETLHGKEAVLQEIKNLKESIELIQASWKAEKISKEQAKKAEDTEWSFSFSEKKKLDQAAWADEARSRARAEQERIYQLEQSWRKRDDELSSREQELAELRLMAQGHEERVRKEVAAQVAIETNRMKRDYEHNAQLLDIQSKSNISQLTDRLKNQDIMLEAREREIQKLQEQIAKTEERAAATVRAALDSASGRAAMDKVQETLSNTQTGVRK